MLPFHEELVPSALVNEQDHGALATITGAFCIATSGLFFLARLWVRWPWRSLFGKDDLCTVVATAFAFLQTSLIFASVSEGFGRKPFLISSTAISRLQKLSYASDLLFVCTLYLARAAIVIFLKRLATSGRHQKVLNVIAYACITACIASILMVAIRENISRPWDSSPVEGQSMFYRWIAVEVLGSLLDVAIFMFPCVLVYNLQMPRGAKAWIVLGFASRLPLILIAIIRLISLSSSLKSHTFTFGVVTSEIITQTEMCYSVVSATIPCLRIFMHAFNTGLLSATVLVTDSASRTQRTFTGSRSNGRSDSAVQAIQPKRNRHSKHSIEIRDTSHRHMVYGIELSNMNMVEGGSRRSLESDDSSKAIVVRRDYDVDVTSR